MNQHKVLNKANCFSSLSSGSNKLLVKEDDVKFNNSYRNSSGHSQNSSGFSQQAIVYTILGSAIFGGLLAVNNKKLFSLTCLVVLCSNTLILSLTMQTLEVAKT